MFATLNRRLADSINGAFAVGVLCGAVVAFVVEHL